MATTRINKIWLVTKQNKTLRKMVKLSLVSIHLSILYYFSKPGFHWQQSKQRCPVLLLPVYLLQLFQGSTEVFLKPAEREPLQHLLGLPWGVLPEGHDWKTPLRGTWEASWSDAQTTSTSSFSACL